MRADLALALQLAALRDRTALGRLLTVLLTVAAGTALLLGVASVLPAAEARQAALDVRYNTAGSGPEGVATQPVDGFWRGRDLRILLVETSGAPGPLPPGVPAVPGPGQALVSPALADLLGGPASDELGPRLAGEVVGRLGREALTGPDELYALVGVPPGGLGIEQYGRFGVEYEVPQPDELRIGVGLGAVGTLVPILVLVATATRLSAAARDRRAAAIRLVGGTAGQVRRFAGVEGALAGLLGAALGVAAFVLLRGPVATALPVPDGVDPARVWPGLPVLVAVVLLVPALAAATATLALRRVVTSPLGVTRRVRTAKAGAVRLVPLAVGLAMLGGALLARDAVIGGMLHGAVLLLGGAALSLVGIAVAGAALARAAGLALARWGRGTASTLAGRQLVADPAAAARTVTGTALVVAVAAFVLAFLPLLAQAGGAGLAERTERVLDPGTLVVSLEGRDGVATSPDLAALSALPGVRGVAEVRTVRLLQEGGDLSFLTDMDSGPPGPLDLPVEAVVADCGQLSIALRAPLDGCVPGQAYRLDGGIPFEPSTPRLQALGPDGVTLTGETVTVPADLPVLPWPDGLQYGMDGLQLNGSLLLPPGTVAGQGYAPTLLVATDGSPDTIESVRTAVAGNYGRVAPFTAPEAVARLGAPVRALEGAALLAVVLAVLTGGLSAAVTTADAVRERRRGHAALVALGTPVAVLRRCVLLHAATPLLLTVGLALGTGAIGSALYLRIGADGDPLPLPWTGYAVVAAAAVVAGLLAAGAGLPFVRAAARPEALRTE